MTEKTAFGWVKVIESYTSEFLMFHFLLVINCTPEAVSCTVYEIYISHRWAYHCSILLPRLRLTPETEVKKYCRKLQPLSTAHER